MNEHLLKYHITPRIVKANQKQKIQVKGLDKSTLFFDDVDYIVKITAMDNWNYKENSSKNSIEKDFRTELICKPENGVITFEHFFKGENEWVINIARTRTDKHIPEHRKRWRRKVELEYTGFDFSVYSLEEDLYHKKPYKGDLHVHTYGSDGGESPAMVGAQYRKWGFDFIAITDHYFFEPSLEAVEQFKKINTSFKVFPGEEVHPSPDFDLHVVSFNSTSSVNAIARENLEKVKEEVNSIAETLDIEDDINRTEIAWYQWIRDEIHKAGGICIYPHPYAMVDHAYFVHSFASQEIFKRRLCDVFEIMGGMRKKWNRIQTQFYYDMQKEGFCFPIVGSTDAHSCLAHALHDFNEVWSLVFSESAEKIPENILDHMSVAIENFDPADKNVYGSFRLVRYTWFLLENYIEIHDAYCNAIGQAILRYVLGDESQNQLIGMLEKELQKFDESFFGSAKL